MIISKRLSLIIDCMKKSTPEHWIYFDIEYSIEQTKRKKDFHSQFISFIQPSIQIHIHKCMKKQHLYQPLQIHLFK